MGENKFEKIIHNGELEEALEKVNSPYPLAIELFKNVGVNSILNMDEGLVKKYLTLNSFVETSLQKKSEEVLIRLSKIENSENYSIQVYLREGKIQS